MGSGCERHSCRSHRSTRLDVKARLGKLDPFARPLTSIWTWRHNNYREGVRGLAQIDMTPSCDRDDHGQCTFGCWFTDFRPLQTVYQASILQSTRRFSAHLVHAPVSTEQIGSYDNRYAMRVMVNTSQIRISEA